MMSHAIFRLICCPDQGCCRALTVTSPYNVGTTKCTVHKNLCITHGTLLCPVLTSCSDLSLDWMSVVIIMQALFLLGYVWNNLQQLKQSNATWDWIRHSSWHSLFWSNLFIQTVVRLHLGFNCDNSNYPTMTNLVNTQGFNVTQDG